MSGDSVEGHGRGDQTRLGVVYVPWYGGTWRRAGRPVRCVVMARRQLDRRTDRRTICFASAIATLWAGWSTDAATDTPSWALSSSFDTKSAERRNAERRQPNATRRNKTVAQKPLRYSVLLLVYARYAYEAEDSSKVSKHDRLTISFNKCHSVLLCSVNRL